MRSAARAMSAMGVALALVLCVLSGCKFPSSTGPSLEAIPRYPNATEGESMETSAPGGLMGANLEQFSTTDSYEEVLAFYTDVLSTYETEVMTHTTQIGRQAAISIELDNGVITVAIQEYIEEKGVNITLMAAGR